MTPNESPAPGRSRTLQEAVVIHFTAEWLPPGIDPYKGKRVGRPSHLPPIPADELAGPPDDAPPGPTPPG